MSAEFGIHPGNDALVGEAVIPVIVHVDDEMFVNLNSDNFSRPDDFIGDGGVIGGRFEIVGRMVVGQNHGCSIGQDGGLQDFTRMDRSG